MLRYRFIIITIILLVSHVAFSMDADPRSTQKVSKLLVYNKNKSPQENFEQASDLYNEQCKRTLSEDELRAISAIYREVEIRAKADSDIKFEATLCLAHMALHGEGLKNSTPDYEEAKRLYNGLIERSKSPRYIAIAYICLGNMVGEKDHQLAGKYFKQALNVKDVPQDVVRYSEEALQDLPGHERKIIAPYDNKKSFLENFYRARDYHKERGTTLSYEDNSTILAIYREIEKRAKFDEIGFEAALNVASMAANGLGFENGKPDYEEAIRIYNSIIEQSKSPRCIGIAYMGLGTVTLINAEPHDVDYKLAQKYFSQVFKVKGVPDDVKWLAQNNLEKIPGYSGPMTDAKSAPLKNRPIKINYQSVPVDQRRSPAQEKLRQKLEKQKNQKLSPIAEPKQEAPQAQAPIKSKKQDKKKPELMQAPTQKDTHNYKGELLEYCTAHKKALMPKYEVVSEPKAKETNLYTMKVILGNEGSAIGSAPSKRQAEHMAANELLKDLKKAYEEQKEEEESNDDIKPGSESELITFAPNGKMHVVGRSEILVPKKPAPAPKIDAKSEKTPESKKINYKKAESPLLLQESTAKKLPAPKNGDKKTNKVLAQELENKEKFPPISKKIPQGEFPSLELKTSTVETSQNDSRVETKGVKYKLKKIASKFSKPKFKKEEEKEEEKESPKDLALRDIPQEVGKKAHAKPSFNIPSFVKTTLLKRGMNPYEHANFYYLKESLLHSFPITTVNVRNEPTIERFSFQAVDGVTFVHIFHRSGEYVVRKIIKLEKSNEELCRQNKSLREFLKIEEPVQHAVEDFEPAESFNNGTWHFHEGRLVRIDGLELELQVDPAALGPYQPGGTIPTSIVKFDYDPQVHNISIKALPGTTSLTINHIGGPKAEKALASMQKRTEVLQEEHQYLLNLKETSKIKASGDADNENESGEK